MDEVLLGALIRNFITLGLDYVAFSHSKSCEHLSNEGIKW